MIREFARRSPRVASGMIYAAGYLAGTLFGCVASYLVCGDWKRGVAAVAVCSGTLALLLAQRKGIVPGAEELNRPIRLFGEGGVRDESR